MIPINVEDFDFKTAKLTREFFNETNRCMNDYGKMTIALMQVGAFYEQYALKNSDEDILYGSHIEEFSRICDLVITCKKASVTQISTGKIYDVQMAGFKDFQIDKHIRKLQEAGFTVVRIDQDQMGVPNPSRSVVGVFSPGTIFNDTYYDDQGINNNTLCIWVERYKDKISVGLACIDVLTGKSSTFEYTTDYMDSPTVYDELERYISIYNPNEVIIISALSDREITTILGYTGISCKVHRISCKDSEKAKNCQKQTYQRELLENFYEITDFSAFIKNFYDNILATQAFCYLLDFIYQHNPNLVRKISEPQFENMGSRVILFNHSLRQLNLIDDGVHKGKYSSVLKMLNDCQTPMGKREFKSRLLNPTTDVELLNRDYDITEYVMSLPTSNHQKITTALRKVGDLQKLIRQVILRRIKPKMIYSFYTGCKLIADIYTMVREDATLREYLNLNDDTQEKKPKTGFSGKRGFQTGKVKNGTPVDPLIRFIERSFYVDRCKDPDKTGPEAILIRPGVDEDLDNLLSVQNSSKDRLNVIQSFFNMIMAEHDEKQYKTNVEYVKPYETEKSSLGLICTNTRCKLLQSAISHYESPVELTYTSTYTNEEEVFEFNFSDLELKKHTASNKFIECEAISTLCSNATELKGEVREHLNRVYQDLLAKLEEFQPLIQKISDFVTRVDLIYCKALLAIKHNYTKPIIQKRDSDPSYVDIKDLRHVLIEAIKMDELYVTNDVRLNSSGILLFGFNASGKSSLIRALGISVVMAQAGLFVPASEMTFYPYSRIFTRILGNDNLFKGESTFMVEMFELRSILKMANPSSLVLGDELCSGTEKISALSIFTSGLKTLSRSKSSYIFATHFHEITTYDEIKTLVDSEALSIYHMTVIHNRAKGKLIYDRKLTPGAGPETYGLEVCKALEMPEEFLREANEIRAKYYPESGSILERETSRYNSLKIRGVCEKCGKRMSSEVHHIFHQSEADENGFITLEDGRTFRKNHPANLMAVCESCHREFHRSESH